MSKTTANVIYAEAAVEWLAEKICFLHGLTYEVCISSPKERFRQMAREWLTELASLQTRLMNEAFNSIPAEVVEKVIRRNFPEAINITYHEIPPQFVYRNSAGEAFDPQPGYVKTPPVLGDGKGPKFSEGAFPGMSIVHDPQPLYPPGDLPYDTVMVITKDMVLDYAPAPFTWLDRYQAVWLDSTTGTVLRDFHTGKIYKDDRQGPSGILSCKDGGLTVGDDPWVEKEAVCPTGIVTQPPHEVDTMDVSIEKLLAIQEDLKAKGYPIDKSVELPRKEGME